MRLSPRRITKLFWIAVCPLVAGAYLCASGAHRAGCSMELLVVGKPVQGKVVALDPHSTNDAEPRLDGDKPAFHSAVEFADDTGRPHRLRTLLASAPAPYADGASVPVLYLAENPERASINDHASLWLVPVTSLIFGSLLLMIGGGLSAALAYKLRSRLRAAERAAESVIYHN